MRKQNARFDRDPSDPVFIALAGVGDWDTISEFSTFTRRKWVIRSESVVGWNPSGQTCAPAIGVGNHTSILVTSEDIQFQLHNTSKRVGAPIPHRESGALPSLIARAGAPIPHRESGRSHPSSRELVQSSINYFYSLQVMGP